MNTMKEILNLSYEDMVVAIKKEIECRYIIIEENNEIHKNFSLDNFPLKLEDLKELTFLYLEIDPSNFNLPNIFKNDKDMIIQLLSISSDVFSKISEELKNNKEIALSALEKNGNIFYSLSEKLRNDKDIILKAVSKESLIYLKLSEKFKSDKKITLVALENLKFDYEYLYTYSTHQLDGTEVISSIPKILLDDKDIAKKILSVPESPIGFRDFSEKLRSDRELAIIALENPLNIQFLSGELRYDFELIKQIIIRDPSFRIFKYLPKELRKNKELALLAINTHPIYKYFSSGNFKYFSEELKNDREIAIKGILECPDCFEYISEELKNDDEIIDLYKESYSKYATNFEDMCM